MKLTQRSQLDVQKWNSLVAKSGASVFSSAKYLDAVSNNWAVLFNDDETGGIACPYAIKLGVHVLYAPFFHRQIEWVGEGKPSATELTNELQRHFPVADAQLCSPDEFPFAKRCHQELSPELLKRNQQAKRMLKKAGKFTVTEELQRGRLLELIRSELSHRVAGINDHSLSLLKKLVESYEDPELLQLNLMEETEWKGAVWLLPFNGKMLYLKGTVLPDAKENGGMYRLIYTAIELAFRQQLVFDFGGSNAEGVRRFNKSWGGEDRFYYHLKWNNAPAWWKFARRLRSMLSPK